MLKKLFTFLSNPRENYPNSYILKYHLLKSLKKIFNKKNSSTGTKDMFDWSLYNLHFRGEIKEMQKQYTVTLKPDDYVYKNNVLIRNNEVKPMHPLYCLLYETILRLRPHSVLEIGCGSGLHLKNINTLSPDIYLNGFDRSQKQLNFLFELFPDLKANVFVNDATEEGLEKNIAKVDLTYTLAVIMHIHKDQTHITALKNLFNLANNQVILIERWKNHDFMQDIKNLHQQKAISWKNIYFYIRRDKNQPDFCLMVCSRTPLEYREVES